MSDTAAAIKRVKSLSPALDQYLAWYAQVKRRIFYPEAIEDELDPNGITVLLEWIKRIESEGEDTFVPFDDLKTMHSQLMILAQSCINDSSVVTESGSSKPDFSKFLQLDQLFENFMLQLHRLESDCLDAFSGFDSITGLRNEMAMQSDIKIELDRLGRRGEGFCLALARVNNYRKIQSQIDDEAFKVLLNDITAVLKRSLRSFDDIYRLDNGDFIMCLKQTKNVGGSAVTARIREFLKDDHVHIVLDGNELDVTMSYCLAEPFPNDHVDDLLVNMRADLETFDDEGDTALEYIEKSPLQRFLENKEEA